MYYLWCVVSIFGRFRAILDLPKVLRRISYLATSSLAVGRFAAKQGSLRSPRGRLVASLGQFQRVSIVQFSVIETSSFFNNIKVVN